MTSRALCKTFLRLASCSTVPSPHTNRASTTIAQGYRANSSFIARWKTLNAEVMPDGMRRNLHLPNGVLKVVSSEDSWSKLICQKPLLASRIEITEALGMRRATSHRMVRSSEGFVEILWIYANANTTIFLPRSYNL